MRQRPQPRFTTPSCRGWSGDNSQTLSPAITWGHQALGAAAVGPAVLPHVPLNLGLHDAASLTFIPSLRAGGSGGSGQLAEPESHPRTLAGKTNI